MEITQEAGPGLPATAIHALRTPLGALVSALDVLGMAGVDASLREEALAVARRQALKLAALIDQFDRSAR